MPLQFLTQAAQAAPAVLQILGALKGSSKPKIQPMPESERYAISMRKALAEPNNSLVRALQDEEFRNLRSGVQSDIKSKVLADRRERSMGRAPVFFDPERSDENIAYQISRGTPMLKQAAFQNAISRILEAAGVGSFADDESKRYQNYSTALGDIDTANAMKGGLSGRVQSGLGGLQQILEIFQKSQNKQPAWERQPEPYGPPKTLWNQMRYNA